MNLITGGITCVCIVLLLVACGSSKPTHAEASLTEAEALQLTKAYLRARSYQLWMSGSYDRDGHPLPGYESSQSCAKVVTDYEKYFRAKRLPEEKAWLVDLSGTVWQSQTPWQWQWMVYERTLVVEPWGPRNLIPVDLSYLRCFGPP